MQFCYSLPQNCPPPPTQTLEAPQSGLEIPHQSRVSSSRTLCAGARVVPTDASAPRSLAVCEPQAPPTLAIPPPPRCSPQSSSSVDSAPLGLRSRAAGTLFRALGGQCSCLLTRDRFLKCTQEPLEPPCSPSLPSTPILPTCWLFPLKASPVSSRQKGGLFRILWPKRAPLVPAWAAVKPLTEVCDHDHVTGPVKCRRGNAGMDHKHQETVLKGTELQSGIGLTGEGEHLTLFIS